MLLLLMRALTIFSFCFVCMFVFLFDCLCPVFIFRDYLGNHSLARAALHCHATSISVGVAIFVAQPRHYYNRRLFSVVDNIVLHNHMWKNVILHLENIVWFLVYKRQSVCIFLARVRDL